MCGITGCIAFRDAGLKRLDQVELSVRMAMAFFVTIMSHWVMPGYRYSTHPQTERSLSATKVGATHWSLTASSSISNPTGNNWNRLEFDSGLKVIRKFYSICSFAKAVRALKR
jgi:hypothetical protein